MAISRFATSTLRQGMPKYTEMWDGSTLYPPPGFDSIATATATGSSGIITISSIPQTYQHLQIRGIVRNDRNNPSFPFGNLSIYFNGTMGSQADHRISGDGSSATALGQTGISALTIGDTATDAQTANIFTAFIIDIHDYQNTSKNKTVRSFIGTDLNGTGRVQLTSAARVSTSAVSSITFENFNGANFKVGTTFELYGIRSA